MIDSDPPETSENVNGHEVSSDTQSSSSAERDFYVVGIGASAGGLEALEKTFDSMPPDTGMAFVIVQHLSPDFKSLMDELLARHTAMPIHRVENEMLVEPNSLYLIPPKQDMIIRNGRLLLKERDPSQSLSLPIDHFFRSMAIDCRARSIAIVLSGTGSDGSRGLRDVHEAGGLVIVQSVESSRFDGMPRSAIDTHLADLIVAPSEIADALCRFAKHPIRSQLATPPINESDLERVYRLLKERHRIDFNHYKPATISRRIARRIQLGRHVTIQQYVEALEENDAEVDQLYKDLLIGVTRFFRDSEAFETLQQNVLPELLLSEPETEEFRVWVAACSTGEEAYSIAIAIDECCRRLNHHRKLKVFATDVHAASIETAHVGVYPASSLADVSNQRRERYFTATDRGVRVRPELRESIVFAPHNLIKDAPFTRLDLVTCRNVLIYFAPAAQKRALSLFHFGLKLGGVLFQGASESPGDLIKEFTTLSDRWKIYKKRRDVRLTTDFQGTLPDSPNWRRPVAGLVATSRPVDPERELLANYDTILSQYMPPAVLVDHRDEIQHVFGGAGQYLRFRDGRPSNRLLDIAEGDLKFAITGGIQRAGVTGKPIAYAAVRVTTVHGETSLRLEIRPLRPGVTTTPFLITFGESDRALQPEDETPQQFAASEIASARIAGLEQELRYMRENLQAAVEELEASNEELQSTNEEMVASNEELQSTNEELHSVNEELYTVNAEYHHKISELTELTNDMDNLFASTEVHTLFLDKDLRIRKFTPKMSEVYNLVPHDIGRRIHDFTHNIQCADFIAAVSEVLHSGQAYEERVRDSAGHHFLMRILPYRVDDETQGVVFTLVDIAKLVEAQLLVMQERERFERAIAANRDGTWDWVDVTQDEMWWSPNCYTMIGMTPNEIPSTYTNWLNLIHPEDRIRIQETSVPGHDRCFVALHQDFEYRMRHLISGEYRWFHHRAIVDHDADGIVRRITGSVGDIHDRKCADMQNQEAIRLRDHFLSMLSHELRNPIGAVLNAVALSLADPTVADREETKIIDRQSRHMARLLDDLLDIARFGRNRIEFRKEPIDLNALIDDVLQAVSHLVEKKHQRVRVHRLDKPIRIVADPARIKQAQINLLTNASKYSNMNAVIDYQTSIEEGAAVITVVDYGAGIPADMLDCVFDLFVQSETTLARSSGGMGVGLSLAKTIVEAHSGTIEGYSEGVGKGSRFQIRIPLSNATVVMKEQAPPVTSAPACRVLLVEDNVDARTMLAKILELRGFEVAVAGEGIEALELMDRFNPLVAVIDIGLPRMSGYDVVREIRKRPQHRQTRLVALTGYGQDEDKEKSLACGFDAHLVKPLDMEKLFEEISIILNQKTTNRV